MSGFLGVLAAGVTTALVVPGYNGQSYSHTRASGDNLTLTLSNAGTWTITCTLGGAAVTGSPLSGSWASGALFAGGYEYRVTTSAASVVGTGSNTPSGTWTSIGASIVAAQSVATGSLSEADATYQIEIREISGNPYIQSASLSFSANAT